MVAQAFYHMWTLSNTITRCNNNNTSRPACRGNLGVLFWVSVIHSSKGAIRVRMPFILSPQSMVIRFSSGPATCLKWLSPCVIAMSIDRGGHRICWLNGWLIFLVWPGLSRINECEQCDGPLHRAFATLYKNLRICTELSQGSVWVWQSYCSVCVCRHWGCVVNGCASLSHPCAPPGPWKTHRVKEGLFNHKTFVKIVGFAGWTRCDPSLKLVIIMRYGCSWHN